MQGDRELLVFLQFALAVLGGAGTLAVWLYATGKLSGSRDSEIAMKQEEFERRLDDGGRRLSDLTGKLLILPTNIAQIRDELTALRADVSKIHEHVSNMRVDVARLEERQLNHSEMRRNGS